MRLPYSDHHAWVDVDLDVLAANAATITALMGPGVGTMAVVKADGYGHGAVECARTFLKAGAWGLGVCHLEEGVALRRAGITAPVLVFTPIMSRQATAAVRYRLASTVVDYQAALALSDAAAAAGCNAPVHVAVETGLGRYGIEPSDVMALVSALRQMPGLAVDGVYTHLATDEVALAQKRLARFMDGVAPLRDQDTAMPLLHAAGTGPALALPESRLDLVRIGSGLYGLRPYREQVRGLSGAWSLMSAVSSISTVRKGDSVGYAGDHRAAADMLVAVVPVGFADGYRLDIRRPVSGLRVFVREALRGIYHALGAWTAPPSVMVMGQRAPVVGRVGMQHLAVDITGVDGAGPGSEVNLHCREVITNPLIPRVYIRGGRVLSVRTLADLGVDVERQ